MGLVRRAIMVLAVADASTFTSAAKSAGLTQKHGRKGVNRFLTQRLDGLSDKPGRGRKPVFSPRGGPAHGQNRL
jgi:transposase